MDDVLHFGFGGVARLVASDVSDPDAVVITGMAQSEAAARHGDLEDEVELEWVRGENGLWSHQPVFRHNAFITNGLNAILERMAGIGTTAAITHFALSADTSAVTLATNKIDPAGTTDGNSFKAVTPANSVNAATSVLTVASSYTQADVAFIIKKMGVSNTSTDAGTTTAGAIAGVWDIIGGTGGSSPYNQSFSADYTGSTSFTLTPSIAITASAT